MNPFLAGSCEALTCARDDQVSVGWTRQTVRSETRRLSGWLKWKPSSNSHTNTLFSLPCEPWFLWFWEQLFKYRVSLEHGRFVLPGSSSSSSSRGRRIRRLRWRKETGSEHFCVAIAPPPWWGRSLELCGSRTESVGRWWESWQRDGHAATPIPHTYVWWWDTRSAGGATEAAIGLWTQMESGKE